MIPKALFLDSRRDSDLGFGQRDELYGRRGWSVCESLQCDTWRLACCLRPFCRNTRWQTFVPFGFVCLSVSLTAHPAAC